MTTVGNTSDRRVIRGSIGKSFLLLLLSAAFVAGGYWMYRDATEPRWISIAVIGFFGLGVLVSLGQIVWPATLTLDSEGFTMRTFGRKHTFKWADIDQFFLWRPTRAGLTKMVAFNYKPDRRPNRAIIKVNEAIAGCDGALQAGWQLSPQELLATLQTWKARYDPA